MTQSITRQLKNTVIYYLARLAMTIMGNTPSFAINFSAKWLGALAFIIAAKERRTAINQLQNHTTAARHPKWAPKLVRGMFNHLAYSVIELCRLMNNPNKYPKVFIPRRSRCVLNQALSQNRGVIFITGHIGNWELMAIHLASMGYPIHTIAKPSYDDRFTRFIAKQRHRFEVHAIFRGEKTSVAKMRRVLAKGGVLGFLIDQDTTVDSIFVPFFKQTAHTPSGAASFAIRTQTPVVVGSIKRLACGRHRIDISAPKKSDDILEFTAQLTYELEQRIRGQLHQWVWLHQRWKTTPK